MAHGPFAPHSPRPQRFWRPLGLIGIFGDLKSQARQSLCPFLWEFGPSAAGMYLCSFGDGVDAWQVPAIYQTDIFHSNVQVTYPRHQPNTVT